MKITGNLGYREIEKLGDILKELGDKGSFRGWEFSIDELVISYDDHYDSFELTDGKNTYVIAINEV